MLNINNKAWDALRSTDITKFLSGLDDETFFFEFKSDDEAPAKLVKEISAFSNTYGGYIFLGINDDKTIGGCKKWNEQRIHTTIHDSLTPTPTFDIKKFKPKGKTIFVIKVEEGNMPPYITNKGQIFERVSSGSFPINDSGKLAQLYNKRQDQLAKIQRKIELPEIRLDSSCPSNLCGYLDLGFSLTCSELTEFQKHFYKYDLTPISDYFKSDGSKFSVSRVGHSIVVSVGEATASDNNGHKTKLNDGVNNFIEIMCDGSIRCRVILAAISGDEKVDITSITMALKQFEDIYTLIFGEYIAKIFISAYKYDKLTVLKQFIPYYRLAEPESDNWCKTLGDYLPKHQTRYGNNLIISSNRVPKNDFTLFDKRTFDEYNLDFSSQTIISELFHSVFTNLGYIDPLDALDKEE